MEDATRIPVVSVVGKSDSGKTTVVEGLVRILTGRGRRVATVKHHVHEIDIDVPGKDSWRHARAGAEVSMVSSPSQLAVVRRVDGERSLEELVEAAGDVDVLVTEGFQRSGRVRIEVARRGRSTELLNPPEELFAAVTDDPGLVGGGLPVFGFDDLEALAGLIESTFLEGREEPAGGE